MSLSEVYRSIELLEDILADWAKLASLESGGARLTTNSAYVYLSLGLCSNADINELSDDLACAMYSAWPKYSGSLQFPVGGDREYNGEYARNKFKNPLRKELATHCLQYLKDYVNAQ